jgi:hypothetical protein
VDGFAVHNIFSGFVWFVGFLVWFVFSFSGWLCWCNRLRRVGLVVCEVCLKRWWFWLLLGPVLSYVAGCDFLVC